MNSEERPSAKMLKQIECGSIVYIKHKNKRNQDVTHYAIVCNRNPQDDKTIVFAVITSDDKGPNLVPNIKKNYGASTVVSIPLIAFRKLTHLSFVNCNFPVFRSLSKLCKEVDSGEASFYHPGINDRIRVKLSVKGMLDSRELSPEEKEYLKEKCIIE